MDSPGPAKSATAAVLVAASLALAVASAGGAPGGAGPGARSAGNPCRGPEARRLLCPDLRVGPAFDLFAEREHGRVELYAGTDIRSRGRGPLELRGHRYAKRWMHANQAIHRVGGGVLILPTRMKLHFFDVGYEYGGSYWKARDPLSMEIWATDRRHRLLRRVRKGPKVFYCFRDLERTRATRRSPRKRVYPACSQDPSRKHVKLGTSVGWSDIYPAEYDRQWVSVGGLRGCFALVLRVDPLNLLHESNERNNRSKRIVRLPYRKGPQLC